MKVKENVTVYICDFCKKKMFKEHYMAYHERWCMANPINRRACEGCVHLKSIKVDVYWEAFDGEHISKSNGFRCKKLEKVLYPVKVEKYLLNKYPEQFEDQEPMPKECKSYENNPLWENILQP